MSWWDWGQYPGATSVSLTWCGPAVDWGDCWSFDSTCPLGWWGCWEPQMFLLLLKWQKRRTAAVYGWWSESWCWGVNHSAIYVMNGKYGITKILCRWYINLTSEKEALCVTVISLYYNYQYISHFNHHRHKQRLSMNSTVYVQISVWPHSGVRVAIVKERWLTTRDHSQELPVDLFLLFTNRLRKDDRDRRSQQK